VSEATFSDVRGNLPEHQAEVMAAHRGTAGTGVPAPPPDRGEPDDQKYNCGGM
jgi:hypothetical protein